MQFVIVLGKFIIKCGAQAYQSVNMGIHPPAANLVAAGPGNISLAKTGQEGADDHQRSAQAAAAFFDILIQQVIDIYMAGCKTVGMG